MVKVFISHSTSSDEPVAGLRDAVASGLEAREYTVLLDVRFQQPGQPWQLKLARFLGECDAALVLVNEAALGSSWVRRETNILHWRKTLHPGMVLVTVLVGEVSAGQLKNSELRYLVDDDVERIRTCSATEIDRLVERFPKIHRRPDDAVSKWLDNIGVQLAEIKAQSTFTRIARELDLPDEEHAQLIPGTAHVLLASQMLHTHDVARLCNALLVAWDGGLDRHRTAKLATMILPVWVDRDEARRIVCETDGLVRRVVVLNVDSPLIGQHYLDRAFCVDSKGYYVAEAHGRPPGDDDPESYLLDQCEGAVRAKFCLRQDQDLDVLKEPLNLGRFFLLLDAQRCDLAIVHRVIAQLLDKIPWMYVLVVSGRRVDLRQIWPGSPDEVLVLDPQFADGDEILVKAVVRRVTDRVGTIYGGSW